MDQLFLTLSYACLKFLQLPNLSVQPIPNAQIILHVSERLVRIPALLAHAESMLNVRHKDIVLYVIANLDMRVTPIEFVKNVSKFSVKITI